MVVRTYVPAPAPLAAGQLPEYVLRELRRIGSIFSEFNQTVSTLDHGALTGLGDNDHPQYPLTTRNLIAGAGLTGGGTLAADRTFTVGAGTGITVNADDVALSAATLASLALADTAAQAANFASGVYTPGLTNVANLDGSTAFECQYLRVGTIVTVSGKVSVNPTTPATLTQLGIALPVASNLGAQEDCGGVAYASGIAGQGAAIRGDAANNRAEMAWIAGDVTDQPMYFSFTYQVI